MYKACQTIILVPLPTSSIIRVMIYIHVTTQISEKEKKTSYIFINTVKPALKGTSISQITVYKEQSHFSIFP